MSSLVSSPELESLHRITLIHPQVSIGEYFAAVLEGLSAHFPISYCALILQNPQKDSVTVEGVFGPPKDVHPVGSSGKKGLIHKVLESRTPMAIRNLVQEPLYEEMMRGSRKIEPIKSPLLCVPLIADGEAIGVLNISPLYGATDDFHQDFRFLSIVSALLSPVVRGYQVKAEDPGAKSGRSKAKGSVFEDLLKDRLLEAFNKIDPYLETKARLGLLDDMVSVVERILITSALDRVGHVQVAAAQLLGINRNTLRKKIKDHKIKTK
jgi:transcriptional regulator with GAF, ATPase, and Fis domain